MKRNLKYSGGEGGFVLITTLLFMVIMGLVGAETILTTSTDIRIAGNMKGSMQALMLAEGGINNAIDHLRSDPNWGPNSSNWSENSGTLALGNNINGQYSVLLYDSGGTNGRLSNSTRSDRYVTLNTGDVLVEATGVAGGVTRRTSLVVNASPAVFQYSSYSDGNVEGNGVGSSPGQFVGKVYSKGNLQLQGNYTLSQTEAEAVGNITPNCSSGPYLSCNDSADTITPPVIDFAYYQDQNNFTTQQVFLMTPTIGSVTSCGGNCKDWQISYQIDTLGNPPYTMVTAVNAVKSGGDWTHTFSWCTDPSWTGSGNCPDGSPPQQYTVISGSAETGKVFLGAAQFNAYTTPTGVGYTSSIVDIFDIQNHIEFIGPDTGSVTVTASILGGISALDSPPSGKIDIEGGAGQLNFQPANGLAIAAEKVKIKSKYSSINVTVGQASSGAIIMASKEFKVEATSSNQTIFNMYGSVVVGSGGSNGDFSVGGNGVQANFTYVAPSMTPQGLQSSSYTMNVSRGMWREL